MPRHFDIKLEKRILDSATKLVDELGPEGLSMRVVAKAAKTTTPTLYERFSSRDALEDALFLRFENELRDLMADSRDVTGMARRFLDYAGRYPNRILTFSDEFGHRIGAGKPLPVLEFLRSRIREDLGLPTHTVNELSLAIAVMMIGTARTIGIAGAGSSVGNGLTKISLGALKRLLDSFLQEH